MNLDRFLDIDRKRGKTEEKERDRDGERDIEDFGSLLKRRDDSYNYDTESMESLFNGDEDVYMLISANYSSEEHKPYLLFYDVKRHRIFRWIDITNHHPYAYSKEPLDRIRENPAIIDMHDKIIGYEEEIKRDPLQDKDIKVTKIIVKDPLVIGGRADSLREKMKLWEADIKYYLNYLMDLGLEIGAYYTFDEDGLPKRKRFKPSKEIIDREKGLNEKEIEWLERLSEPVINYKRVALDIEVYNPRGLMPQPENPEYPIFVVSLRGSDGLKKVLYLDFRGEIIDERELKEDDVSIEVFNDELSLIKRMLEIITDYPIVITFNGDNFDLPYILNRSRRLGFRDIDLYLKRGKNEMRISWGIHIDLYKFFKNVSIKTYAFNNAYDIISLDTISKALLNKGKKETPGYFDEMKFHEIIEYAYTDAELTYELTSFNNDLVMRLITIIGRISNMTLDDVTRLSVSNWIRNRMFYLHRKRNYLIPRSDEIRSKKWDKHFQPITKGKKYVGALVINPKPGIHFNVVVVDFASLYPSILKEYNISYETVNCPHKECMDNKVPETTTWICKKNKGIISEFAGIIRDIRVDVFKKLSKDPNIPREKREFYGVIQRALKVIINALYGVIGSDAFQFYYLPAAEAVTTFGRYVITKSIEKAEELGLEVIYGDTDSLFIKNPDEEKLKILMDDIRRRFKLQLEIDKVYKYTVLSSRKKNYFGLTLDGGIDIKGLMGKKSNTPPFIREVFYKILDRLRSIETPEQFREVKEDIIKIVRDAETRLINREIPIEELVITITLSKPTDKYTKTTPQHVKAARQLERVRGIKLQPGQMIRIVKVRNDDGVAPVELVDSIDKIDSGKYIDLLHSTLQQILEVLDIKISKSRRVVSVDANRVSLDKFFKF